MLAVRQIEYSPKNEVYFRLSLLDRDGGRELDDAWRLFIIVRGFGAIESLLGHIWSVGLVVWFCGLGARLGVLDGSG